MADQTETQPTETTEPAKGEGENKAAEHVEGTDWKSEARKWESRAKGNLSELEKVTAAHREAQARLEELEKTNGELQGRLDALSRDSMRRDIALEHDLPANAVAFLAGDTREEIEAAAKGIRELIDSHDKPMRRLAGSPPVEDTKHREELEFVDALVDRTRKV